MYRLLRLSAWLLGGLFCIPAPGQAVLPPGNLTPGALHQLCASLSDSACVVPLTGQHTLALAGDWQLPRSIHLQFAYGGSLHVTGGVLYFAGGSVDAPAGDHIFPESDRIRELSAARPEWFADGSQEPLPAEALAAAYAATEPWGTIYLQGRRYLSPFYGCVEGSLHYLSPRTFVGAGRPSPDSLTKPTRLEGGTILLGGIIGTAPLRLASLGIDVGPEVSKQFLHGCEPPGVFIEQPGHHFVSGDRLLDVSVLTTGAFNMHSVMIAGHENTEVRDLWIWTLGGTHGLVMKSSQSVVDGFHCRGAVSDCLIVKSDYATDFQGRAVHDRVAHVDIAPLEAGGYVGGIMVDSRWDTVSDLSLEDITETGSRYSLILLGSTFFRPRDITIRRWTASAVSGACLFSDKADSVRVSDFHCNLLPDAQAGIVLRRGKNTRLDRGTIRCEGEPGPCAAGQTDGVIDGAAATTLKQLVAAGLGGYPLRSSKPTAGALDEIQSVPRTTRGWAPYTLSRHVRLLEALAQVKPDLRILYTAVTSRVSLHPSLYLLLSALLACMVAWEIVCWRRRRHARRR